MVAAVGSTTACVEMMCFVLEPATVLSKTPDLCRLVANNMATSRATLRAVVLDVRSLRLWRERVL
jgi:hypothetical protein